MEHQIYRVARRTTAGGGVELTLDDHPAVKAKGRTAAAAEERLLDLICSRFGDGEPVLDYSDEAPPAKPAVAQWWQLRGNERVTTTNLADLHAGGVCARCGVAIGDRRPKVVRQLREKISGDAVYTWSGPVATRLFSARMMALLVELGLSPADFAGAVDGAGRTLGEVMGGAEAPARVPVKPSVGVRIGAQKCPKCGFTSFGFVHRVEKDMRLFMAATDLATPRPLVIIGGREPDVLFSDSARAAVRKRKDLRGFVWGRVGLVKPEEIEPKLKFDPFPKP